MVTTAYRSTVGQYQKMTQDEDLWGLVGLAAVGTAGAALSAISVGWVMDKLGDLGAPLDRQRNPMVTGLLGTLMLLFVGVILSRGASMLEGDARAAVSGMSMGAVFAGGLFALAVALDAMADDDEFETRAASLVNPMVSNSGSGTSATGGHKGDEYKRPAAGDYKDRQYWDWKQSKTPDRRRNPRGRAVHDDSGDLY